MRGSGLKNRRRRCTYHGARNACTTALVPRRIITWVSLACAQIRLHAPRRDVDRSLRCSLNSDPDPAALLLTAAPLVAEVQERGATIDDSIYNAPDGLREFGVQDPDGHDIAFGQPLNR